MPFRVPKFLGEFNGKICSECISYNLEFQNFPGENPRTPPPPPAFQRGGETPELSPTCTCGTWFVPPPVNSPPTSILFENPGYINVNKGVFYLIICFLRIKIYNVLNYNNCSTDWSFSLRFQILLGLQMASLKQ